jgi:16S rRNA (adenine1518-N6/adenine1519-N6)-dimethyltransferase
MTERAKLKLSDSVLEIGPGRGMLTSAILSSPCGRVDAVELDTRLRGDLEPLAMADGRLTLHWGDAVRFDYSKLLTPTHVIANLPYHITTPLLWVLLENFSGELPYMLLMVQKETAVRLTSGAGSRDSGPLGITLSALGNVSTLRTVPRGSFSPMPRVDSAIVEIMPSPERRGRAGLPADKTWRRLLSGSFAQRRKTLVNNWASSFGLPREESARILASLSLQPVARPEELSLDSWLALAADEKISSFMYSRREL